MAAKEETPEELDQAQEMREAEDLQRIRADVQQRQLELAAVQQDQSQADERRNRQERARQIIADLQARAHVQERPFVSHVPVVGRLIAFIRHTWNSVAARWYVLGMFQQQDAFNQAIVQAVQELIQLHGHETRQYLDGRLDELKWHLDEVKRYLEQVENQVIGSDRDLTVLARKLAEREYWVRQWERQATEERAALARRLAELGQAVAALDHKGVDE